MNDSLAIVAATLAIVALCAGTAARHKHNPPEPGTIAADAVTGPAALSGETPETRKMDCRQISAGEFICKLGGTDNASNDD